MCVIGQRSDREREEGGAGVGRGGQRGGGGEKTEKKEEKKLWWFIVPFSIPSATYGWVFLFVLREHFEGRERAFEEV